jgi:hypothetical protein
MFLASKPGLEHVACFAPEGRANMTAALAENGIRESGWKPRSQGLL